MMFTLIKKEYMWVIDDKGQYVQDKDGLLMFWMGIAITNSITVDCASEIIR